MKLTFTLFIGFVVFFIILIPDKAGDAKLSATHVELKGAKSSVMAFKGIYGKTPSSLSDLLQSSPHNYKKIMFYEYDKIPKDYYCDSFLKMINNIESVEISSNSDFKIIGYQKNISANGIIVYSLGKNKKDDSGLYDPELEKDDVSIFVKSSEKITFGEINK